MGHTPAILDIGSNSVRFAFLEQDEKGAFFIPDGKKLVSTTRLGRGLDKTGLLSQEAREKTVAVCQSYCAMAQERGVPVYGYATSAVRDASNRQALLDELKDACPQLSVFILSGEEEGRLAYKGAFQGRSGTLIDIGGGSLQVVTAGYAHSYPAGCVRAKDACPERSLPAMQDELFTWLSRRVSLCGQTAAPYCGVGGTITTLGALLLQQSVYDGAALDALKITPALLFSLLSKLSLMGDEARARHPLLQRRHDVILQGGLILLWLMEQLHIKALTPMDQDGIEGFAAWLWEKGLLA